MTAVMVDSNVLLDLATEDPLWYAWSAVALESAADRFPLVINAIIYAEVSAGESKTSTRGYRNPYSDESRSHMRLPFSRGSHFSSIDVGAERSDRPSPTSLSEPMPRSPAISY